MPWFEYVCEKCGARVARQRAVAHREVAPRHNAQDGCWDGVLRRVAPVAGPTVHGDGGPARRPKASAPDPAE